MSEIRDSGQISENPELQNNSDPSIYTQDTNPESSTTCTENSNKQGQNIDSVSTINNHSSFSESDVKSISSSQSRNVSAIADSDSVNKNDVPHYFSDQNIDNFTTNSKVLNELDTKVREDDHKENVKFNNDLADHIPGLYRLLDLCKDDGSNGLVDKIIISKEGLKNMCNKFVQDSFKSISEIDYNQLNSCSLKLIGCYGNRDSIARFLLNKNIINHQLYGMMHSSRQTYNVQKTDNKLYLRPGIYFLIESPELGLVIHWPEHGCYEDNVPFQQKKNMINLHRYLTKLTDYQICLMSEQDLDSFDWKRDNEEETSDDDDDDVCYEFEVKTSQEEREDFEFFDGFNVSLPNIIKSEIGSHEISLRPKIIESISYQAFFTQKIIAPSNTMTKLTTSISKSDLMSEWGKHSVKINRSTMDLKMLETLVKGGLDEDINIKNELESYCEELKNIENDFNDMKEKEVKNIKDDAKLLEILAYKRLKKLYSRFENYNPDPHSEEKSHSTEPNKEQELNDILSKYPDLKAKLDGALIIDTEEWLRLKRRFFFASLLLKEVYERAGKNEELDYNEVTAAGCQSLYNLLRVDNNNIKSYDAYKDYIKHLGINSSRTKTYTKHLGVSSSHTKKTDHKFNFKFTRDQIKEYSKQRSTLVSSPDSDLEMISTIFEHYPNNPVHKKSIIKLFIDCYTQWKLDKFPKNIKKIEPQWSDYEKDIMGKLDKKREKQKQDIERNTFKTLCNLIENKFPNGPLFRILCITEISYWLWPGSNEYKLDYELEIIQPKQLQITIYETMLEQVDCLEIQEDELHIPRPNLPALSDGKYGYSFAIDLDKELRHISKFDPPKNSKNPKYLVIIWNNKTNQMELYFDTAQNLGKPRFLRNLNTSKDSLIAVNESKGLIGIYDSRKAVLNVRAFDEGHVDIYPRNSNISILKWYKNSIPDIQHFLFIKDTEELCFVEKGGRARIYSLVIGQFRPGTSQFPSESTAILSTPDGACIVAFTKEPLEVEHSETIDEDKCEDSPTDNKTDNINIPKENSESPREIVKAYIYFCIEFGKPVNKVIEMPSNMQSLEFFQFSTLHKRQIHLTTLDINNGSFHSLIVKITHEKTQYRFQRRFHKKSFGQVKFEPVIPNNNSDEFIIIGKGTNFTRDIKKGENIVIMSERHKVIEIISDERLKLVGKFPSLLDIETWLDFRIEPKAKLNLLIDSYKLMFEKYPIDSCIDAEQNKPLSLLIVLDILNEGNVDEYSANFKDYILDMFKDLKRETNKPQTTLKKFSTIVTTSQKFDINNSRGNITNYQLGEWIIQLSCLIPIQIAVAKNNQFQPLHNGLTSKNIQSEFNNEYRLVDSIARNISFGLYEGIFNHFGDHQVKVVSSMGEQTCGKSYLLNHLVGSTFDGSAMRCTEGVWMSLVITKEYIYVALDFEGLKSLERSPQEDLFLTLFNTAVSNLVLFKNPLAINRDTSSMFQRFQDGATLFETDSKVYQAKLCIIIKDVPKTDRDDVVREFYSRFEQLVKEEKGDNFITKMYKDGLNIMPWPIFNDAAWFRSLAKVKNTLDQQEARYENARIFLQNIKVIMAKLKVCDWGSLDENLVQNRISALKRVLHNAVFLGMEQKDEHLTNRDTGKEIDDPTMHISKLLDNPRDKEAELMCDSKLVLYKENTNFIHLSTELRVYFEDKIQQRKESFNDTEWFSSLEKFLKCIIDRRIKRLQEWFKQNTQRFPQDNNDVIIAKYALEQEISKISVLWTLCGLTCYSCRLRCLKNRDHEEDHDCLSNHQCQIPCQFTEAHADSDLPICSHQAGHEGKHACKKANHLCGEPCNLNEKRNCQKFCAKEIGHEDDNHLCQSIRHYCGNPCSLTAEGNYRCPNMCIMPHEEEHEVHKCENDTCPIQCPIKDCQRKCSVNDHFHALSDVTAHHFCGNEHQCLKDCEQPGVCKIHIEPQKREEIYKGLVQDILFTKYIQLSERLKCNKRIPPNKFKHDGPHVHHVHDSFHFCDVKCPFCEYYCTLPYGHPQKHDTRHGNMTQTEFTAEDDEFEFKGYKLRVGDNGTFVLCSQVCKELGRHRHIDYCQSEDNCKLGNQGQDIQHILGNVRPNPEKKKDYISHRLLWERTGFKDPYTFKELQEFAKCDHECRDVIHHETSNAATSSKSYCGLTLFHPPLKNSTPPNGIGYVSLDGHHFTCENPSTREAAFHIIFVLDRSYSMDLDDCKPIDNTPVYNRLKEEHNNRLGAVFNAVYSFLHTRLQLPSYMTAVRVQDTISIILFNHEVIVPYENQSLTSADAILDNLLQNIASGSTNFDLALTKAGDLIDKYFDPIKTNIIIFLSDGQSEVPESRLEQICKKNQERKSPLYLYTVLFGSSESFYGSNLPSSSSLLSSSLFSFLSSSSLLSSSSSSSSSSTSSPLEQMAKIAQSYHPQNTSPSALRCQFTHTINEVQLVNHFTGVAESLRRYKPTLLKKNVVL